MNRPYLFFNCGLLAHIYPLNCREFRKYFLSDLFTSTFNHLKSLNKYLQFNSMFIFKFNFFSNSFDFWKNLNDLFVILLIDIRLFSLKFFVILINHFLVLGIVYRKFVSKIIEGTCKHDFS
jgi:hypothetical protein